MGQHGAGDSVVTKMLSSLTPSHFSSGGEGHLTEDNADCLKL